MSHCLCHCQIASSSPTSHSIFGVATYLVADVVLADSHAEAHFAHCEYLSDVDFDALMRLRTGGGEVEEEEVAEGSELDEFEEESI